MRQAQYRFLAELGKAYEQQAIKMHEMRQSYYREIDHLRDQLGIKARNPSFDMKEVQFFDAKAYRPLSWKELADLLLVQRIEANGGERTVELVPVRVLCRDCRNKFASEVPDLPQDAESQVTPDMILTELPPEENVEYTAQGVSRWAQTEISVQAQVDCSVQTEARPEFFPASPEESAREVSFRQVTLSFDTALLEAADSPPSLERAEVHPEQANPEQQARRRSSRARPTHAESRPLSFEPEWHEATFAHDADERAVAGEPDAADADCFDELPASKLEATGDGLDLCETLLEGPGSSMPTTLDRGSHAPEPASRRHVRRGTAPHARIQLEEVGAAPQSAREALRISSNNFGDFTASCPLSTWQSPERGAGGSGVSSKTLHVQSFNLSLDLPGSAPTIPDPDRRRRARNLPAVRPVSPRSPMEGRSSSPCPSARSLAAWPERVRRTSLTIPGGKAGEAEHIELLRDPSTSLDPRPAESEETKGQLPSLLASQHWSAGFLGWSLFARLCIYCHCRCF
ncbi:unnamed protein product [Effrenium voratum]|nr:unnamed protein product [Effrenium voratum]